MRKRRISLIVVLFCLIASTTATLLEAQENGSDAAFFQTKAGSRAVVIYNGVEIAFRYCPAGTFKMGAALDEPGRLDYETQEEATIDEGFWICETETTQEQWGAVGVKKGKESRFKGAKLPVDCVTWDECDAFVKKLNASNAAPSGWRFALPTEEQWEYACRAGTAGATYGVPLSDAAWCEYNSEYKFHEVGTKTPNAWGIYDMLGNVSEWTNSEYKTSDGALLTQSTVKDSNGASIDSNYAVWITFVFRGGSYAYDERSCRPANRAQCAQGRWHYDLGFRVCLVPSSSK